MRANVYRFGNGLIRYATARYKSPPVHCPLVLSSGTSSFSARSPKISGLLTSQEHLPNAPPRRRAVPPSVPELVLAFLLAQLDAEGDLSQQHRLVAYVGHFAAESFGLLADLTGVHYQLASGGPGTKQGLQVTRLAHSVVLMSIGRRIVMMMTTS